jgi:hypothetical protein
MSATGYGALGPDPLSFDHRYAITFDRVPKGEIEIRRAGVVSSRNGERLGHVSGFLVDRDGRLDDVLLERTHLGRSRETTIPITAVTRLATDSLTLSLEKGDLGARRAAPAPLE